MTVRAPAQQKPKELFDFVHIVSGRIKISPPEWGFPLHPFRDATTEVPDEEMLSSVVFAPCPEGFRRL